MCVAAPGCIVQIHSRSETSIPATVAIGPGRHEVDLVMVPEAEIGDAVIVHSGYAISRVTPGDARARLEWLGIDEQAQQLACNLLPRGVLDLGEDQRL